MPRRWVRARDDRRGRRRIRGTAELILTVLVAIAVAMLIQAFLIKPYRIPSGSMIPTLEIGQRVLVNRLASHPGLGAVVVFHPPAGADSALPQCGDPGAGSGHPRACDRSLPLESSATFIKRVVGLPGDRLRIVAGQVYRNGRLEPLRYSVARARSATGFVLCTVRDPDCNFPQSITVPAGEYFMMGDNRGDSLDSRFWGPVPRRWLIGEAFFTYWPPARLGVL